MVDDSDVRPSDSEFVLSLKHDLDSWIVDSSALFNNS